jgi:hypothetical protein
MAFFDGEIYNCTIAGNSAECGGGLFQCDGPIRNCIIVGNSAQSGGGMAFCDGMIKNCLLTENTTRGSQRGGGLAWCNATICNCTISNNTAITAGGLLYCYGTILNCIIWGNTAAEGAQLMESSQPVYSCIQDWTGGAEGNISQDPQFADSGYHLSEDSPCIDAGINETWMSGAVDLDGNPRILLGISSLTVDIGAYEYDSFRFKIVEIVKTTIGGIDITWDSRPGHNYALQSCFDLRSGPWNEEATISSQGESTTWADPDPTSTSKFYRIELK